MGLVVEALTPKYDLDPHLVEHVPQIVFRIHPGGHCITEEDEVLNKQIGKVKEGVKTKYQ